MIAIQITAVLFAILMVYLTVLHYHRKEFTVSECIVWLVIWGGLIVVVIFPTSVSFLLDPLKIRSTFDFILVAAIVVLFANTFRQTVALRRINRKLEALIREDALARAGRHHRP